MDTSADRPDSRECAIQQRIALGLDTTDGPFTYGTAIADTVNGPLGLVKLGGNALTLTGENTYSGGTEIGAGTLIVQYYSLPAGGIDVAGGATLEYDTTYGPTYQQPASLTGSGTLLVTGGSSLTFGGAGGDVDVDFSPGAIDVEGAATTLVGSSHGNGQWAENCALLKIAAGCTFNLGANMFVYALSGGGTLQCGWGEGPLAATIGVAGGSAAFFGRYTRRVGQPVDSREDRRWERIAVRRQRLRAARTLKAERCRWQIPTPWA